MFLNFCLCNEKCTQYRKEIKKINIDEDKYQHMVIMI